LIGLDEMTVLHVPVLAAELIDLLAPAPGMVVVDATFGAGGHARLLAERVGPEGLVVAIDRDPEAAARFYALAAETPARMRFVPGPFAAALVGLADEGLEADIVIFDLGLSSMQIDVRERGFSYSCDAPLDMRMDPTSGAPTARDIVTGWDERRLARVFRELGEERFAGPIARAIVAARGVRDLDSTQSLVDVIVSAVPAPARFAGGHPAKRVFQALRIAVNQELAELDAGLPAAWSLLGRGGQLAAISFHSLEDRRVKRFLAARAQGCICPPDLPVCGCGRVPEAELLRRRAVAPSAGEVAANPRSRSAHLRAARRLSDRDEVSP